MSLDSFSVMVFKKTKIFQFFKIGYLRTKNISGQLRRDLKPIQKKAKPKDDISQYGQYYLNPSKWRLQCGNKSKLNIQEEERILKSQRDLALQQQSVGYLTSTKAFIEFCQGSKRFREAAFLKKFT